MGLSKRASGRVPTLKTMCGAYAIRRKLVCDEVARVEFDSQQLLSLELESKSNTEEENRLSGKEVLLFSTYDAATDVWDDSYCVLWHSCCDNIDAVVHCMVHQTEEYQHYFLKQCIVGSLTVKGYSICLQLCIEYIISDRSLYCNANLFVMNTILNDDLCCRRYRLTSLITLSLKVESIGQINGRVAYPRHYASLSTGLRDMPSFSDLGYHIYIIKCLTRGMNSIVKWICHTNESMCSVAVGACLFLEMSELFPSLCKSTVGKWKGEWIRWAWKWCSDTSCAYVLRTSCLSRETLRTPDVIYATPKKVQAAKECGVHFEGRAAEDAARICNLGQFKSICGNCRSWNPQMCCRQAVYNKRHGLKIVNHVKKLYGVKPSKGFSLLICEGVPDIMRHGKFTRKHLDAIKRC